MNEPDRWAPEAEPWQASVADAPLLEAAAPAAVARLELLEGDEVIQLMLRPSPWYVAYVSYKVVLGLSLLALAVAMAYRDNWTLVASIAFPGLISLALFRLALATLDWASRLYVLTNRRVLRFRGVIQVNVAQCRLERIGKISLHAAWHQKLARVGSIRMSPASDKCDMVCWNHVARPHETHQLLIKAIRRAQSGE